ncbi:MAG: hypothetical protein J7J36_06655 [Thermoplasmata archaeon]|nr:hypothetical protein [Thermoplasmata archaeon]
MRKYRKINELLVRNARKYPIYECMINPSWKEMGLAIILLSRKRPDGNILFGCYLVDIFCLGLKDTFWNSNFPLERYENELKPAVYRDEEPIDCDISMAHQIIYGAIEYAHKLGFNPHKDFRITKHILKDKNNLKMDADIEFGKNGKPLYIAGPNDDIEAILKKLGEKLGEENFYYIYEKK